MTDKREFSNPSIFDAGVVLTDTVGIQLPDIQITDYSGDLNTELVRYLNGSKEIGCQMVRYSNAV